MAPRFFQPRRRNLVTARHRSFAPQPMDLGRPLASIANTVADVGQDIRRQEDIDRMNRLRPEFVQQLVEVETEVGRDPDAFNARAETILETTLANAGFYSERDARSELGRLTSRASERVIRQAAAAAEREQIGLAEQRREGLIEDAIVASRAGDSEAVADAIAQHRQVVAQGIDRGWYDQAEAEAAEAQILDTLEQERQVGAIVDAYESGGLAVAKATAERVRSNQDIDLPLRMRDRAAQSGLAQVRAMDRDRRAAAAEARANAALQQRMAVDDLQMAVRNFQLQGADPWEVYEEVAPALDERQRNLWEQRLTLEVRAAEIAEGEANEQALNEYRSIKREQELAQLEDLFAQGVYAPEKIGDMIASGRIAPGDRDRMLRAWSNSPQAEAERVGAAGARDAIEERQAAIRTAYEVQEQLGRGATYSDAVGDDLEALGTYAEVRGIRAGEVDPQVIADWGAVPPNIAQQVRRGFNDPDMMRWASDLVGRIRETHGEAAAGQALNQFGGETSALVTEMDRIAQAFPTGSEEAARQFEQAVARIADKPRTQRTRELIQQEEAFIEQSIERRALAEANGWKEWFRRHGLLVGEDDVQVPPRFRDQFELNLEGVLLETRHPSDQAIPDNVMDMALERTMRVWGPARMEDGDTRLVPHPVDRIADRIARKGGAPAGLAPTWVYEQAFEANRDALTSRDSPTYVADELSRSEFVEMVEEGRIQFQATDTRVLEDGGAPPVEMWVTTNDGRQVPVGGFGDSVEFRFDWRGIGRSDDARGAFTPLEGTNRAAQERLRRAREWVEWAAPYVPGLDDADVAMVHNLMARTYGLDDVGSWVAKDFTILRNLPTATMRSIGLDVRAVNRLLQRDDEREIGEVDE